MLKMLSQYSTAFASAVEGSADCEGFSSAELHGGARIAHIFYDSFQKTVQVRPGRCIATLHCALSVLNFLHNSPFCSCVPLLACVFCFACHV